MPAVRGLSAGERGRVDQVGLDRAAQGLDAGQRGASDGLALVGRMGAIDGQQHRLATHGARAFPLIGVVLDEVHGHGFIVHALSATALPTVPAGARCIEGRRAPGRTAAHAPYNAAPSRAHLRRRRR